MSELAPFDYELGELDYAFAIYDKMTSGFRGDMDALLEAVHNVELRAAELRHRIAASL